MEDTVLMGSLLYMVLVLPILLLYKAMFDAERREQNRLVQEEFGLKVASAPLESL